MPLQSILFYFFLYEVSPITYKAEKKKINKAIKKKKRQKAAIKNKKLLLTYTLQYPLI